MSRDPTNIRLRREDEDRRQTWQLQVADAQRATLLNTFENKAQTKLHGRLARDHVAAQNKLVKDRLDDRRRRLALLLESERLGFEKEVQDSFESPEQVKARSFAYARQLRDQREAARKKLVAELEERRFRLESDVLRKRESQITAERVALDRLAQLDEKQQAMAAEKIEMSAALEALEKEQAKHANRSRVEAEARRRLVEETRIALEGQVAQKMRLTAADVAHRAAGDAAELADIRNAVQSKRESDAAKRDAARDEYLRLLEYNKADQAVRRSAAEADKAEDVEFLRAVLAREAIEAEKDNEVAAIRKAETMKYRAGLEGQLHLAAEETSWMDKHFASEQEKEWERRQAKWDAEASARNALLRDVATVRKHQVEDRARSKEEERARDAAQVSVWREQQAVANEREAAAQAERQRKLALQQSYTARQLAENEAARAAAIQATYLEARLAEKVERDYQSRVDALLREPLPEKALHARKKTGLW